MSDLIRLRATAGGTDTPAAHGTRDFPHDRDGIILVPPHAVHPLVHRGGYVFAGPDPHDLALAARDDRIADMERRVAMLQSRVEELIAENEALRRVQPPGQPRNGPPRGR